MTVQLAEVVAGTEIPTGIGTTGAARCMLRVNGRLVAGVVKRIPRSQVIAEVFCANLLRGWGLPVPPSYLVADHGGEIAFASEDATYPNLMQRLGVDAIPNDTPEFEAALHVAMTIAVSLANAPLAAVADEAIDNRDRNLQNILWDGTSDAWIDHAFSLGMASIQDANKLCGMAIATGQAEAFQKSAISLGLAIDRAGPQQAASDVSSFTDAREHAAFVAERLSAIGQRVLARFPTPDDLLFKA